MTPKPKRKFTVRRETLRQLDKIELGRARGGDGANLLDTGDATCPTVTHVASPQS